VSTLLRLPGSVAEIAAGPKGPDVGAFFDFDGTLIAGYSASHLSRDRFRTRDVSLNELARTLAVAVSAGLGRAGFEDLLRVGAAGWKGRAHAELEDMGERIFQRSIADLVYPEARALVRAHVERGHTVVLCSSATEYQAEPAARYLGIERVLCNRYTKQDGLLTGDLEQPVIWGPSKASTVQHAAAELGVNLARSYFYADGNEDVALMYLVGHPRPTNPARRLAKVAAARGWPTLKFSSRSSRPMATRVKQLAGASALVPMVAVGTAVGLARRDRRAGANFSTPRWLSALLTINGVTLDVVGRENLTVQRPALFVYNHRNNADPFIAASLVERDFGSVVDKELRRDPIAGVLGRLADVMFVDWSDSESLTEAMHHLEGLASDGLSILAAPEGPAVDTTTVGPFRTDAFRVAVATDIPIVPIVVRNADVIAGRNSSKTVPGVVEVAVLAPIPVEGWSAETLDDHVASVRQQFLDTLAEWPEAT